MNTKLSSHLVCVIFHFLRSDKSILRQLLSDATSIPGITFDSRHYIDPIINSNHNKSWHQPLPLAPPRTSLCLYPNLATRLRYEVILKHLALEVVMSTEVWRRVCIVAWRYGDA